MIEIGRIHLEDKNSPRKAFYQLILLQSETGVYLVEKRSGAKGMVLDRRVWEKPSREKACKMLSRIVKRKTNPYRKSPRHYRVICSMFKIQENI